MEDLPRIWWIRTGLASAFPFYAAGVRFARLTENAYCRVVSSYSPSIKALAHARERASIVTIPRHDPLRMLVVTIPKTPGDSDLPGVEEEKSAIYTAVGESMCIDKLDYPDVASMVDRIKHYNIAHFAYYGVSDQVNPLESGLVI